MADERTNDVDQLATEQVRPGLDDLDLRSPGEIVDVLLRAEAEVTAVLAAARDAIAEAVAIVEHAVGAGGRLIYVGAGTPGRLAALDAAECPPTFGVGPDVVVALLAGGGPASGRAVEGAEDNAAAGAGDVEAIGVGPGDVVVGIAASGRTPYVVSALATARNAGSATIAIVNNAASAAGRHADLEIELLTGPEVVCGSTRLHAGTAQKVVLNTISTAAMIRLGKTYGAWMVDVSATNEKLRRRARRILREVAGVDDEIAAHALEAAGWETKTALVALLARVDAETARARLAANAGRVRDAVNGDGR
jgi:N-acetylmuramic acid 6-phosphate etherase